jgi:hypothetical protein
MLSERHSWRSARVYCVILLRAELALCIRRSGDGGSMLHGVPTMVGQFALRHTTVRSA